MTGISRRFTIAALAATAASSAAAATSAGLEAAIAKHCEALAAYDAAGAVTARMEAAADNVSKDVLRAVWDTAEFKDASEAEHVASAFEMEAGQVVIAYPCQTLADVVRKVAYIRSCRVIKDGAQGEDFGTLIDSLANLRI